MFGLVLLTVALVRDHPAEFKAAWEKAQARAALWDRHRHGLIDRDTFYREQFKLLTPQEEEVRRVLDQQQERLEQDLRRREAVWKNIQEQRDRRRARRLVGPPPPPDKK